MLALQLNKKYRARNRDGVEISGEITKIEDGRVEFGKTGRVYIFTHGWEFKELD